MYTTHYDLEQNQCPHEHLIERLLYIYINAKETNIIHNIQFLKNGKYPKNTSSCGNDNISTHPNSSLTS